ncbi:MAG: SMC family ATPase, partial [Dehalococcoidales bacterium]|nr:SMC family ATPase [Dehalococcoidales bacterium]
MIPVRLKIRNFMPYRGDMPVLSFEGIRTACICGDNGSGKSAIVDSITWALWGKTRTKSDDDLIHLGETETEVEFDFSVLQQQYRIIRKHARPKKTTGSGQSSLDLMIASDDGYKVISGDRITQTQDKIIRILNMDYDTFINSALLRQGHADEFTRQQPAKRKEVLANILGLDLYDRLEEKARQMARDKQAEKTRLENTIRDILLELSNKEELEAEFKQAQKILDDVEKQTAEREDKLNRLRQTKQTLENQRQQLAQLEEYINANNRQLELRKNEIAQH